MTSTPLYLVRHEEADDGSPDEYRALTGRGRRRMHATARLLAREIDGVDLVYTSPLVRAVQTAEIVVSELGFDEPVVIAPELAGPTSLDRLARLALDAPRGLRSLISCTPEAGGTPLPVAAIDCSEASASAVGCSVVPTAAKP